MIRRALKALLLVWGAVSLLGLLLGGGLLLTAGWWLRSEDILEPADAIVILGGDVSRAIHAAELYNRGLAPVIYLCRPAWSKQVLRDLGLESPSQEAQMQFLLAAKGVPPEAVRVYGDQVLSTVEEAESLGRALRPEEKTLILVTAAWHSRRTKLTFSALLPGRRVLLSVSHYEGYEPRWWTDQGTAQRVLLETAKFLHYFVGKPFRTHPVEIPPQ